MQRWPLNGMWPYCIMAKFHFDLFSFAACVSRRLTSNAMPIHVFVALI